MPLDATALGYSSTLWDEPDPASGGSTIKVGGRCVVGTLVGTANPGDVVVVDTTADDSYSTTTSANATSVAGFVVAGLNGSQWDYVSAIVAGQKILVLVEGVVLATASAAIATRGTLVGTSTTAGRIVTTSTANATIGRTLQVAAGAASQIRVLVGH